MPNQTKYPNNLFRLIKDAGMSQAAFARHMEWRTEDVNRRGKGKNSIMPPQLEELRQKMGWDASQIYGEYKKVATVKKEPRIQLNTAIKLFFKNEGEASIHGLASLAYKGFYNSEPKEDANVMRIITACVIAIQNSDKLLNDMETSFIKWMSVKYPDLFGNEVTRYFAKDIPVNELAKIGKMSRAEFFEWTRGGAIGD